MTAERIQKILAQAGFASRRSIEEWIKAGRIQVNGKTAELGQRITVKDHVVIDGKKVKLVSAAEQKMQVLVYHKPVGEVSTTSDPEGRPTVFDKLPKLKGGKWQNVGRLDVNTSGLMLFTNDGGLAHQLMHPSSNITREYAVRTLGTLAEADLQTLTQGVTLDDGKARVEHIVDSGGEGVNHWYHVCLAEGRNRIVRRLFEAIGFRVSRLVRVRFGPIFLSKRLPRGRYQMLSSNEIEQLKKACDPETII